MSQPMDDSVLLELDALLDGALSDSDAAVLHERIDAEPALRAEYERRRRIVELVRGLPAESAPDGFSDTLMERLPATRPIRALPSPRRGGVRSMWLWGVGLAAAAALVLAVSLDRDDPSPDQDWTLAKEDSGNAAEFRERNEAKDIKFLQVEGALTETGEELDRSLGRSAEMRDQAKKETIDSTAGVVAELDEDEEAAETKGTRDRAARRGAQVSLLQVVEKRNTALTPAERTRYLDRVARVSDVVLRAHVERVLEGPVRVSSAESPNNAETRSATGKSESIKAAKTPKASGAPTTSAVADNAAGSINAAVFEVAVAKRADAEALRKLLMRAFPPMQESGKKVAEPSALVSRSEVAADSADAGDATRGQLRLEWSVSARDAQAIAIWMQRIGLRNALDASGRTEKGIRRADDDKTRVVAKTATMEDKPARVADPVSVRVRIRFGPRTALSERPKGDDK